MTIFYVVLSDNLYRMAIKMINKGFKMILGFGLGLTFVSGILCLFFDVRCALICFVFGVVQTMAFVFFTAKRYDELKKLNAYLSSVCVGNYELRPAENTEGELSVLKNNLYKVISLLKTQNEMLQEDKVYLSQSLADISHQLKTPMTSAMVMTDLLKESGDEEKRREFIRIIQTQLEKMKWLITTLLKLAKLDSGTVMTKKEPFSIKRAVDESLKPFLVLFDLKGINVKNECEEFFVTGDESWSIEALENIIKNCAEHTGRNGTLKISSKSTNIFNSLFISDNGSGIAPEDIDHIFERFYHGKNSSSDSVGIGLALAKAVFERENAKITVSSKEGEGSCFEIRFYNAII